MTRGERGYLALEDIWIKSKFYRSNIEIGGGKMDWRDREGKK